MSARRAFTLIELLVVITIIGLLIAIAVPSLARARGSAKRAACASNLRQIGIALRAYLGSNSDRFPFASYMPSISPEPLDGNEPIHIADVLANDVNQQKQVFKCSNDQPDSERLAPNQGKSYFDTERSSYEYQVRLGGMTMEQYARRIEEHSGHPVQINSVWIFRDFNNFHAPGGTPGSRRYLYNDGHVTDYE